MNIFIPLLKNTWEKKKKFHECIWFPFCSVLSSLPPRLLPLSLLLILSANISVHGTTTEWCPGTQASGKPFLSVVAWS